MKRVAAEQLPLPLPAIKPRYTRDAFVRAQSNAGAIAAAEAFLTSDESALAICGPAGSGKTHFASILAAENGGLVIDAATDELGDFPEIEFAAVDNLEAAANAKALLTFLEMRRAAGRKTVFAGLGAPAGWSGGLRDLRTRFEAMPRASLDEPDEALMRAVIARGFADRQWQTREGVPAYAAPRLPRTFAAARSFVEMAGAMAIAEKKPVSLAMARKAMENLSERDPTA